LSKKLFIRLIFTKKLSAGIAWEHLNTSKNDEGHNTYRHATKENPSYQHEKHSASTFCFLVWFA
jgi:hypothetical protein